MAQIEPPGYCAGLGMIDLLSERLGGKALACSDERFSSMHDLVLAKESSFTPESFGPEGQIYSGWESGRNYKRSAAHEHDWCILRLGSAGVLHLADIDTSFFRGNYPSFAELEACGPESSEADVLAGRAKWTTILDRSPLKGHSHNFLSIKSQQAWRFLRLKIYPDGGVARLRIYGEVRADPAALAKGGDVELSSAALGGRGISASDMFYSPVNNMLWPGRAENMGQGWETARKRGPGNNWAIVQLGCPGRVSKICVDTNHFKHNAPESCAIFGVNAPGGRVDLLTMEGLEWRPLLERAKLRPHAENVFEGQSIAGGAPVSHVKLEIFPDGGVSRLRIFGTPER